MDKYVCVDSLFFCKLKFMLQIEENGLKTEHKIMFWSL